MRANLKSKALFIILAAANSAVAATTTLTASTAVMNSVGSTTLSSNGYLGSYLVVPAGGATIDLSANATEAAGSGSAPHMDLVIADSTTGFSVNSTSASSYTTGNITLPAGTYSLSDERDYAGNIGVSRAFTVNSLSVNTISGGTVSFSNVNTDASGNALAAANTYISNFRQGIATVNISGLNNIPLLAGTPITVKMARNAFNFGAAIPGNSQSDINGYLGTNPASGSTGDNFQQFLNTYFNAVVPENVGKWSEDEATQNTLTMGPIDTITAYAKSHDMTARMHNVIWGNQQPAFINTLLTNAQSSNTSTASTALASLNTAITNRIGYYVGGGDKAAANPTTNQNNTVTGDIRSQDYSQIDVLNEAVNTPPYYQILGAAGTANVYKQVATAAANAGANVRLYTNEYNVLQNSADAYSNWYRQNIEAINNAGSGQVVSGIGVQYYPTGQGPAPSSSTMQQILMNLAVEGLPIALTEYGQQSSLPVSQAPTTLDDALRLIYGDPLANTFMIWGWWNGSTTSLDSSSYLVNTTWKNGDGSWNLSPTGQTYVNDLDAWSTPTQTLIAGANGQISFNGSYGSYYLSGQATGTENANLLPVDFTFNKGTSVYNTAAAKPTNWFFWKTNGASTWGTGANWTDSSQSGAAPDSPGYTAYFGTSATSYNLSTGAATTVNVTTPVTVTVSSPQTVGMLVFDSLNSYTLAGSTISLQGYNNSSGHLAAIYVNKGSHTINAPISLLDNTTITVLPTTASLAISSLQSSAASLTMAGAGSTTLTGASSVAGGINLSSGTLTLSSGSLSTPSISVNVNSAFQYNGGTLSATGLTVGGLVTIGSAGGRVMQLSSLTINGTAGEWTGKLDLSNNALIVQNGDLALITTQVATAFDGGSWSGTGITSSVAEADASHLTAIGVLTNDDGTGVPIYPIFDGLNSTITDVLVKFTYFGDANLDGQVDGSDYSRIDNGFVNQLTGWANGDFNYDGIVNGSDYTLIDNAFNSQGASLASENEFAHITAQIVAVPEPTASVIFVGLACLIRRRKRYPLTV